MTEVKQAVVLAAGRGTRMKELTESTPKPLLKVAGSPLVDHVIHPLIEGGVRRIVIVIGYLGEQLEEYLTPPPVDVEIIFVRQEKLDGTGGALRVAAEHLEDEPFVLTFGDVLTDPENFQGMLRTFVERPSDLLMAVWDIGDPSRGAAITIGTGDLIEKMVEKPPPGTSDTPWINAGIIISQPKLLEYLGGIGLSKRGEVELPDAFSEWITDGGDLRAYRLKDYWSDVGTPEDLEMMNEKLSHKP